MKVCLFIDPGQTIRGGWQFFLLGDAIVMTDAGREHRDNMSRLVATMLDPDVGQGVDYWSWEPTIRRAIKSGVLWGAGNTNEIEVTGWESGGLYMIGLKEVPEQRQQEVENAIVEFFLKRDEVFSVIRESLLSLAPKPKQVTKRVQRRR